MSVNKGRINESNKTGGQRDTEGDHGTKGNEHTQTSEAKMRSRKKEKEARIWVLEDTYGKVDHNLQCMAALDEVLDDSEGLLPHVIEAYEQELSRRMRAAIQCKRAGLNRGQ